MKATEKISKGIRTLLSGTARGFFELVHNGFALLGLAVLFAVITLIARPEVRQIGETQLMGWLQERQPAATGSATKMAAAERATVSNPKDLPKQQAAITYWLSKKYNIAPEPLSALVAEAFEAGTEAKLDPTLILAIMAIESGFNPFAQSPMGAQGLMQVMTNIHSDKYRSFGGKLAAFDPVSNVRVGIKVLKECINRAGSTEGGLKLYVGAGNLDDDSGYAGKVMAEHTRLLQVTLGRNVPTGIPLLPVPPPVEMQLPVPETVASISTS